MTKELWEQRRDNLQALVNVFREDPGNRAAFCRKYGLDPLQIGQYFTAGKNARRMGERKAREIEGKIPSLPAGWLDREHDVITAEALDEAAPQAVATDFLTRIRRLQKEYEALDPKDKKMVDEEIEQKTDLEKLLKPKK